MKRCYPEQAWALYVEGDISGAQTERMETHLVGCDQCREIVAELQESQLVIKSLRPDSAPATAHAILRERVLDEVFRQESSGWTWRLERMLFGIRWRYAVCGLALIAFSAALLWQLRLRNEALNTTVNVPPAPSAPAPIERVIASEPDRGAGEIRHTRRPAKPIERPATPAAKPEAERETPTSIAETSRQTMVKMLTDDPNVVIYWIVDQKGGSNESIF